MLSKSDATKALRTHFKKHLVATLPELVEVLRNPSRSSVYRRLKTLGYLASYTHAGAHYTLPEVPDFDEAGLWRHQGIGFSKCGNLKDTIAAWVGHSAAGYTLNELEAPLKLRVQNAPLALVREGRITRNTFAGVYVYLSGDPVRAEEQMASRHQFRAIRTGGALPGELVIDVLATAIRGHQWELDHAAITQALRDRGRTVTRAQVDQVLTALAGKKNGASFLIEELQRAIQQQIETCAPRNLFPVPPVFDFQPKAVSCVCGGELKPYKTARRTVATLHIGTFHARLKYRACGRCKRVVKPGELDRLVAPHCKFGFDVIEYVGRARFEHCQSQRAVQAALALRHVAISLREIDVLGRQFIVYLSRAHRDSQASLKQFMQMSRGGYILHLDGTCEGNSPHLMSSIDELSGIVLGNIKIPSENSDRIIPFLQDVRAAYGDPIALVHDMGTAILKSVAQVFPAVPGTVCHFHFLRDIGKDLMTDPYNTIRRRLRTYNVRGTLRNMVRELKAAIDSNPEYTGSLHRYLRAGEAERQRMRPPPVVEAYLIAAWIVEAKSQGNGLGFPFDRPHFNLYQRLAHAWPALKKIKTQMPGPMASTITLPSLRRVLKDLDLSHIATLMQHRMIVFEQLREAMRIALPDSKGGLKDTGETDLQTIREKVTAFRNSGAIRHLANTDKTYGKMVRQIDKYQDKLFADPITVHCAHGSVQIQPQRTNNLMEQFFRDLKRDDRRRSGTCTLARRLTAMLADAPLVKNLKSSHYMEIILNGEATLAERFSRIDRGQVRKDAKDAQNAAQKYPRHMRKLFKIPDLPDTLGHPNPSATEPQIQI